MSGTESPGVAVPGMRGPSAGHLLAAASGCKISTLGKVTGLCVAKGSISIPVSYRSVLPLILLFGGALVALLLVAVLPRRRYPGLWAGITVVTGLATMIDGLVQWANLDNSANVTVTMAGQIFYDHFSAFFVILFGSATVLGGLISDGYLNREGLDSPEPYVLMMICSAGAVLMAQAAGLITLFLGLEVLSISLYTLSGYHHRRPASGEAALKYFILGSFSSAIFIYGAALVYGATGSTQYVEIYTFLTSSVLIHNGVLLAGMGLLIVGLGFKVAAVPFHFWTPDVYQGAPTPFVGYMAAVAKAAGFAGLVRVLMLAFPTQVSNWRPIIWVLAVASVLVGGVLAIVQSDLKRMLAYSSISQAGFVLIGLQDGTSAGVQAVAFYVFTYAFMVIGTFAIVEILQGRGEARNDLSAARGLAARSPWLATALLVLLLGQAGIPLTSGFLGKWVVIEAVVSKGQYALGIIGMLGAAIAAFPYLRVALMMYVGPGSGRQRGEDLVTETDQALQQSDLQGIMSAGLTGRDTALALRAAPTTRLRQRPATTAAIAICTVFTIFAGVSTPLLTMAHSITLPW
jgi:NADH-quinone oxidoreductase subunit N